MPDILQDKLKKISSWVDSAVVSVNPSVQEHITEYDSYLREGNIVVLVAHSQGNLYGNIAYLGLDPKYRDGFGIVSVANPDSSVAGGGPYTTIDEDKIILPLQFLSPFFALSPNLDNFFGPVNLADWSGHKFIDSYMASGHDAETVILYNVVNMIDNLNPTVIECGCVEDLENPSPMTAKFIYFITSGGPDNAPFTVQFSDTSTGSPTVWLLDFGDGWTGTEQNPTHTYATNGPHTVTLKAYVSGSYTTVPPGAVTGRKKDGIAGWMDGAYTDFATREWSTVSPPTLGRRRWTYTIFFNPTVHAFMGEDAVYSYNLTGFPTTNRVAELQIRFHSAYYPHGGVITDSGKRPVITGNSWHTVEDVTSDLGTQFNVGWTDDTGFTNYGSVGGYISAGTRVKVTESTMSSRCIQTIH